MAGSGSSENASDSPLCANNCGFFANPKTRNLCSVCYAAFLKENLISIRTETEEVSQRRQDDDESLKSEDLKSDLEGIQVSEPDSNAPARKSRCGLCNKKVGLLGFKCRCGGLFCGKHRFQEEHGCSVNMKKYGREKLAKENIEIKGQKLQNRI